MWGGVAWCILLTRRIKSITCTALSPHQTPLAGGRVLFFSEFTKHNMSWGLLHFAVCAIVPSQVVKVTEHATRQKKKWRNMHPSISRGKTRTCMNGPACAVARWPAGRDRDSPVNTPHSLTAPGNLAGSSRPMVSSSSRLALLFKPLPYTLGF